MWRDRSERWPTGRHRRALITPHVRSPGHRSQKGGYLALEEECGESSGETRTEGLCQESSGDPALHLMGGSGVICHPDQHAFQSGRMFY